MSLAASTPTLLPRRKVSGIFEDFDSKAVFEKCEAAVLSKDTNNFVLEFENVSAQCALNVDAEGIREICSSKRTRKSSTRWINIWSPETQQESLVAIATHYGFSPRLLGLMKCKPLTPQLVPTTAHYRRLDFWHTPKTRSNLEKVIQEKSIDIERDHERIDDPSTQSEAIDLNHYTIVNEVWHYASVDWGSKYLCIGYNSLYNTAATLKTDSGSTPRNQNRPAGKRVWMWLVLCDDGTVISIHENAYPNHDAHLDHDEQKNLDIIRRNLRNVFCQISSANEHNLQNPLETLPIRATSPKIDGLDGQPHASQADIPSLLFYYLFDDWYTSYSLVARKEHQYGTQLELLRARMFTTADLQHVDDLHHYGRQLAVLKRIYQSYSNIIERVLDGSKQIENTRSNASDNAARMQQEVESTEASETTMSTSIGVPISTMARVRFERLKDRIGLYCLNEIQDCIDEKDALVLLNFNLIAIKESSAVESLTRITILLAKVTILFLPVSLMTGYFSIQIEDLVGVYTSVTYWTCFAVIITLSFCFLVVFGRLSGTQESKPIYQSLSRVFFNKSKDFFRSKSAPQPKTKVTA
ncbi:hypothetical protein MMC26_000966 [Xylographa opegraphella]|nr:hypothetical protein [Xylographa opegraphella]